MIAQIFSGCSLEQFSNIFPHVAIFTITMLCFSSILTSDSQFSVICYSIFLYNSLYWYCTAILKFLISQFSILNSQLLATAVLCISISQLVILNSQLYWYCTAILKFLKFSVLNSQFSILNCWLQQCSVSQYPKQ